MDRRKFLAGIGATVAGGAVATGTGAFTSVQADRSVAVAVGDEETSSYLVLESFAETGTESGENGAFAANSAGSGSELVLDFNDEITDYGGGGSGPGKNSTYEFDEVFEVENQGTQTVDVSIETLDETQLEDGSNNPPGGTLTLSFYPDGNAGSSLDGTNGSPVSVSAGNSLSVGVKIVIGDVAFEDYSAEATVEADAS